MAEWAVVRDSLADLWDWWGEGVHLRPQPRRERGGQSNLFSEPYAVSLAKEIAPTDLPRGVLPEPVRMITLDAHLGDALFLLNCVVHYEINRATGWLDRQPRLANGVWGNAESPDMASHPYQTRITGEQQVWVAFAPAGREGGMYFRQYCSRINSAGWRPGGVFPSSVDMAGADFSGCNLALSVMGRASLRFARLSGAFMGSSYLTDCDLRNCSGKGLQLTDACIFHVDFSGADLREARFSGSRLGNPRFQDACIEQMDCTNALLEGINERQLFGADVSKARFV
jgi:hypothetical protein